MIGVFVTFESEADFDQSVIAKIAAEARQHLRRNAESAQQVLHARPKA